MPAPRTSSKWSGSAPPAPWCGTSRRDEHRRLASLRDRLRDRLAAGVDGLIEHAAGADRLPNTLSVSLPGVHAGDLLEAVGDNLAASAGAACHGLKIQVSHVLAAMGVATEVALGTIRFSVGRFTSEDEVDRGVEIVLGAMEGVRA